MLKTAYGNISQIKKTIEQFEVFLNFRNGNAKEIENNIPEDVRESLQDINSSLISTFQKLNEEYPWLKNQ